MTAGELKIILRASTARFTASLKAASAQTMAFATKLKTTGMIAGKSFAASIGRIGGVISNVFRGASRIVGGFLRLFRNIALGIVASLALIVWQGMNFEDAMLRAWTIVGQGAKRVGQDFDDLRNMALKLGRDTLFTATQAAQGMKKLALAGFEVKDILKAIPSILEAAIASGFEIGQVADVTIAILRAFQIETEKTANITDILTKAFTSANTTLMELGEGLSYVAPAAAGAFGATLNTVNKMTAALMSLADAGLRGTRGGTQLRMMVQKLLRPTSEGMRILNAYGISVLKADSAGGKLASKIQRLSFITGNYSETIRRLRKEQIALILAKKKDSDEYAALSTKINEAEDSMSQLERQGELLRDAFTVSGGTLRDFEDILDDMHASGMDAVAMSRLLGVRAGAAGMILARSGYEGYKKYVQLLKPLTEASYKAGELTKRISQILREGVKGRFKDLGATIQIALVTVFDKFKERLAGSIFDVRNLINVFIELTDKKGVIEGFINAIIKGLSPLTKLVKELEKGFIDWLKALTPEEVEEFFTNLTNTIMKKFDAVVKFLKETDWQGIFEGLKSTLQGVLNILNDIIEAYKIVMIPSSAFGRHLALRELRVETYARGKEMRKAGVFDPTEEDPRSAGKQQMEWYRNKMAMYIEAMEKATYPEKFDLLKEEKPEEKKSFKDVIKAAEEASETTTMFYDEVTGAFTNLAGAALEASRKMTFFQRKNQAEFDKINTHVNNLEKRVTNPKNVGE